MQLYFILCSDENFNNRKGGPFGVPSPDEMKSKSHANLMREDEDRMRWQQPPVSSPTDNRSFYFIFEVFQENLYIFYAAYFSTEFDFVVKSNLLLCRLI